MKMNKTKKTLRLLLAALAFGTVSLTAVHSLVFAWLTGFIYHDNIRGYVPAGLTGMMFFGLATLFLLFRLAAVARRHENSAVPYVAVGCLAAPLAIVGFSLYTTMLIPFLGKYSWQNDFILSALGGTVCTVMAVIVYRLWLSKKADNQALDATSAPALGADSSAHQG